MGDVTLLIGGARSGKSTMAVEIGQRHTGPVVFIATAEVTDADMAARIERHRAERPAWPTVEAPLDLAAAITAQPADSLVIIDCLTVWVGNLMHHQQPVEPSALLEALRTRSGPAVIITNEVGMGVHPETEAGRIYRDTLGVINQIVASAAARTLLFVAGRAVRLDDPWELMT